MINPLHRIIFIFHLSVSLILCPLLVAITHDDVKAAQCNAIIHSDEQTRQEASTTELQRHLNNDEIASQEELFADNQKSYTVDSEQSSDDLKMRIISRSGKFTKADASIAGLSLSDLKNEFRYSVSELLTFSDYSASDLRHAGFHTGQLVEAKLSSRQLLDAGYNANIMKAVGYSSSRLSNHGYSAGDLLTLQYDLQVIIIIILILIIIFIARYFICLYM